MPEWNSRIKNISVRTVLNSCGHFCIEAEVLLEDGSRAYESSPSGTTIGKYDSKMISSSEVKNVLPDLSNELIGLEADDQPVVDNKIVSCLGMENDRIHGANLSSALSMANYRAAAKSLGLPLYQHISKIYDSNSSIPQLIVNILNGGAHAGNELPITEFMLITMDSTAKESIKGVATVYHELRDLIKNKYGPIAIHVGLEGGFAPPISDSQEAINLLNLAIENSSYRDNISIGLDIAASNLFDLQMGKFKFGNRYLLTEEMISYFVGLTEENKKICYLEDPLAEDHAKDWAILRQILPNKIIAGDDIISTSSTRLSEINSAGAVNAVVFKINQCGTVSALIDCFKLAQATSLMTIISQRSCETDSNFLTNLAIGLGADFLKAGACARERIIKYNSLLRIAENF